MRGVVGRECAAQRLEERQLKAIGMRLASGVNTAQMSGVVPPLGQVVVRRLILWEAHRWQWYRGGRACGDGRECPAPVDSPRRAAARQQQRHQSKESDHAARTAGDRSHAYWLPLRSGHKVRLRGLL